MRGRVEFRAPKTCCGDERMRVKKRWGDYRRLFPNREGVLSYEKTVFQEGTFSHWVWQQEQRYLHDLIARRFGGRRINYLDFACGSGRIIGFLQPMVDRATGVDISSAATEVAAGNVPGAQFVSGDVSENPSILDGPYDLITAFRFFLNAQDSLRHAVLEALRDKIAPDGLLVFNIHGNAHSARAAGVWIRRTVSDIEGKSLSRRQVETMLRRHGYEVVEMRGISLLTPKLLAITPKAVADRMQRWVERTTTAQRACVTLIFACRPVGGKADLT